METAIPYSIEHTSFLFVKILAIKPQEFMTLSSLCTSLFLFISNNNNKNFIATHYLELIFNAL